MYKSALEIWQNLAKENPKAYEPDLAKVQMNLGNLYFNIPKITECETSYINAVEILQRLAKDNPILFEPRLAYVEIRLGTIYNATQRLTDCEIILKAAQKIYERLSRNNPEQYNAYLADARSNLSDVYSQQNKYNEAYDILKKLIPLVREFYNHGADIEELLSNKLTNLSFYANIIGKFDEGEKYSKESLAVDSTDHLAYTNLAAALLMQGRYVEAEKLYLQFKSEFKDGFLDDLNIFAEHGVIPKEREADVERIKKLLNE